MEYIRIEEVRKRFQKSKGTYFVKGYFEGYNNPNQSEKDIKGFIENGGKMELLSERAKDFFIGKVEGVKDRKNKLESN